MGGGREGGVAALPTSISSLLRRGITALPQSQASELRATLLRPENLGSLKLGEWVDCYTGSEGAKADVLAALQQLRGGTGTQIGMGGGGVMARLFAPRPKTAPPEEPPTSIEEPPPSSAFYPLKDPVTGQLIVHVPAVGGKESIVGLSDYQLEKMLGRGSFGTVYEGIEIGTGRRVAIKVADTVDRSDPELRRLLQELFEAERRLQGSVETVDVVRVYATGLTARGDPFVVMEYLPGGNLQDFITRIHSPVNQEGPTLNRLIVMATRVVAAVAKIHGKKIIHCDLKPENIFLGDDERPIMIGDFGIAEKKTNDKAEPDYSGRGTAGYYVFGEAKDFPRDAFALGMILYELFTGRLPWGLKELDTEDLSQLLLQIAAKMGLETPVPPSQVLPQWLKSGDEGIAREIDRIILKALSIDLTERYEDANAMLFDLETYKARTLEEEAREIATTPISTRSEIRIRDHRWRAKIQGALGEYRTVYDRFPDERIKRRMLELNGLLFDWGDRVGDEDTFLRAARTIEVLDPRRESDEAKRATRLINVTIRIEGTRPVRGEPLQLQLEHFENRAGILQSTGIGDIRGVRLSLTRGGTYALSFATAGAVPIVIPLPVRPGNYEIRVPIYPEERVPAGWVIIPAGPAAARQGPGSYCEQFNNWREIGHDYAVGPLVTNRDWFEYLKTMLEADTESHLPKNWKFNRVEYLDNNPIDPGAPVTHITYEQALGYLKYLSDKLGFKPLRLPRLNEWKRLLRGNDPRPWPWGDATPDFGLAGFRYSDPRAAGAVKPLSLKSPVRDLSPFSTSKRPIIHVAGNVQKMLDPGTSEEQERIAPALGLSVQELSERFIFAGGAYDAAAPTDLDILQSIPRGSAEAVGPFGFFPVLELNSATPTPSIESLVQGTL